MQHVSESSLLNLSFDAVSYAIVVIDTQCVVQFVNKSAREFLKVRGRNFDSCVGGPVSDILPIAAPLARKALASREFAKGEGRVVEKGRQLFFEITPLMRGRQLIGAVVSLQRPERFEEMAVRLEAYQSLFMQLQAVFDSSSDGIWVTDGEGVITNVNKASIELNGMRDVPLIGRNIKDIVAMGGVDQAVTLEVMKHRRQISLIQHIKSTGRQILATGTPVFDEAGKLALVVVNERDLTELNNLRRDLAIAKQSQESASNELKSFLVLERDSGGVVAESKTMRRILAMALKLAQLNVSNILLTGESGVGKGMLAKFLHNNSRRKEKPFLSINCAALPESLFESELFGYEGGAFTGAKETGRLGLMNLAADGTLFLDEVGEMPLALQAKLLTCLDQNEFIPIGANRPVKVRCALVFATNKNLEELVRQKRFREDFFYRLSAFTLEIPPLRERRDDIFELARRFLLSSNEEFKTEKFLSQTALDLLHGYAFNGNVRELRSLIRKGAVMSEENDLAAFLALSLGRTDAPEPSQTPESAAARSLPLAVAALERELLLQARAACANTREMAAFLGVNQSTVVRKLAKYAIGAQEFVS